MFGRSYIHPLDYIEKLKWHQRTHVTEKTAKLSTNVSSPKSHIPHWDNGADPAKLSH